MNARSAEIALLAVWLALVPLMGRAFILFLAAHKPMGILVGIAAVFAALTAFRRGYRPQADDARRAATKFGAYLVSAVLGLVAVIAPARWDIGATIAAAEVALVFDLLIVVAARPRTA